MATDGADAAMFGRLVRELRENAGINQTELAEASGLRQGYISLIEAGKVDVRLSTARKLAEALQVPLADLFGFDAEIVSRAG